jgi:hypothetical protein
MLLVLASVWRFGFGWQAFGAMVIGMYLPIFKLAATI